LTHIRFKLVRLAPLAAIIVLGGCAFLPTEVEVVAPPTEVVAAPAPVAALPAPAPAPPPEPQPVAPEPAPAEPQHTAVLLSDDIPVFAAIADEVQRLVGQEDQLTIHNIDGDPSNIARIKTEVANADQLVAIGLLAATVGQQLDGKRMVFCQVFNYQDSELISPLSKGVNLLPPFEIQLAEWLKLAPELRSVGIITGPGQAALADEIRAATQAHGIELKLRTVGSDKEALYAFKRLTPEIQGLWLLPDNRILSPEVVREIMSYSARHRTQVVVFGANLLGMGGLMSVTSDAADVAEQVLARFDQVTDDGELTGPNMRPLTKMLVEVNADVARHLGLAEQLANVTATGR